MVLMERLPGNAGHKEVQTAIENAIARILACGKAPGILTTNEEWAQRFKGDAKASY